jgi:type IV secretion system protein VirB10
MIRFLALIVLSSAITVAQTAPQPASTPTTRPSAAQSVAPPAAIPTATGAQKQVAPAAAKTPNAEAAQTLTVPAGTTVMLKLLDPISTKVAREGDHVYTRTSFPVAIDNHMAIPAGTYVEGEITSVKKPGHLKGRAELRFTFNRMIFPSGYTLNLPAAVKQVPGPEDAKVKDSEGTIQGPGNAGRDTATIAGPAAEGTIIGAVADGGRGAGIGAGIGAAAGVLIAAIEHGRDVELPPGTSVEMVTHRPIAIPMFEVRTNSDDPNWDQQPSPVLTRTQQPRRRPIPVLMPPLGTPY